MLQMSSTQRVKCLANQQVVYLLTVEVGSNSMSFTFQVPARRDCAQGGVSKVMYNKTDVTLPNGQSNKGDGNLKLEFGMEWYF